MADTMKNRRWMPIVLGLSLAINLAVVAAVGGAAWRHNGDERGGPRASKGGGALYIQALPRETRRAIREQLRATGPRPSQDNGPMLVALRQEPFDAAAAAGVLEAQSDHNAARRTVVTEIWLDKIMAMEREERHVYADRLEALSQHGAGKWKERRKGND